MSTRHYRLHACLLGENLHLVTTPDFPGAAVEVSAPDPEEALARAWPWLIGCILRGMRD